MKNPSVIFAYFLCAFGFLISALWFYPGYMSYDAVVQFLQAWHFQFSNTHPPIMAFVWHYLMLLTPRGVNFSAVMFLFQLLLLWIALTLWVYLLAKRQCGYLWLIPLVGLFPNIIILNAFIWTDIQMGNSLLLALTLWVLLREGIHVEYLKIMLVILIVFLVFYAFCLRHEAVLVCVPIFYLWTQCLGIHKWFARGLLTLGLLLIFSGGAWLFQVMLSTHEDYPAQQVMFYDLVNLSITENHMLIPMSACRDPQTCFADVRHDDGHADVVANYMTGVPNPAWFSQFQHLIPDVAPLRWTYYALNYQQLKAAWLRAIVDHPLLYLHERVVFFVKGLGYMPFFSEAKQGVFSSTSTYHTLSPNVLVRALFFAYGCLSFIFGFAFAPWFWLGLNLAMLVFLRTDRQHSFYVLVTVMLWSGLILDLSHFIVGTAHEFRYLYWTMLATLFSFVLLLINKKGVALQYSTKVP